MSNKTGTDAAERQRRAALPASERQLIVKDLFIDHDRLREVTSAIRSYHMPVEGGVPDFGNLSVIAGEPRTGKTFAFERYAKQFELEHGATGVIRRVVLVDIPVDCNLRSLAEQIADQLNIGHSYRTNTRGLIGAILRELVTQKVEFMIFDETQEVFDIDRKKALKDARGFLRKILNLRTLNVCVGGLIETYNLMAADKQLKGRGMLRRHIVHPYNWENAQERLDFRLLCDLIDEGLPFKEKSGLGSPIFAQRLYYVTDGIIGLLKEFVFAAACRAMNADADKVEMRFFAEVWDSCKPIGEAFNPFADDIANAPSRKNSQSAESKKSKAKVDVTMFQKS
jgi:hypothetical protein